MDRRTKLLILILVAIALLGLGIWILLKPFLGQETIVQPPSLPSAIAPTTTLPTPTPQPATGVAATPKLSADIKNLQDAAGVFVSRIGSGSYRDGFRGYNDVLLNSTPEYRVVLLADQKQLQQAHPMTGPAYGITTRTVSVDARSAVAGADTVTFIVQAQQAEDTGNPGQPTKIQYKEATVTFQKQADKSYLLSTIVWKDIEP